MTALAIGVIILLFVLLFLGVPVGFTLVIVGVTGIGLYCGFEGGMGAIPLSFWSENTSEVLVIVPLFLVMAFAIINSGISTDLFDFVRAWLYRLPGALGTSNVVSCAILGAIQPFSGITLMTLTPVAYPQMLRAGYGKRFSLGILSGACTLGSIIPPSIPMVVFGIVTEQSIGKLLIAGILPGITLGVIYAVFITVMAIWQPNLMPKLDKRPSWEVRMQLAGKVWPVLLLFIGILSVIYLGVASVNEAGAVGAIISIFLWIGFRKREFFKEFFPKCEITAAYVSMLMLILTGALIVQRFVALSGLGESMVEFVMGLHLSPWGIVICIQLVLILSGMFLPDLAIIVLLVPIFFPIIVQLGFDPIWFGVVIMVNLQLGVMTPPFGFNLFLLPTILSEEGITYEHALRGSLPFMLIHLLGLILIMLFPKISLLLPSMMKF
ncbi:MAG: TRAP transporter large permease subunit [Chloroflexota bacterium]|nr:TRAP transporter large permease subunit [Chloroflexota bacterium]